MSYDTSFRPRTYDEVLGQEAIIRVLREIIKQGRGFQQSYVFAGLWGGGKTTLGRIFARALLCQHPKDTGDPCDECLSCRSFLEKGVSEDFTEVDAGATSKVEDVRKILDLLQFQTFSGKQRIYLIDESHRLSSASRTALLKSLEDEVKPGSKDKQLVCIFCTTEPESMHPTIFSRCAPIFRVQAVAPEILAKRLAFVCEQEKVPYDREALVLVSEIVECHIRDALKAIEGIALLGAVNLENTRSYLHLDLQDTYLSIIENLGTDLQGVLSRTDEMFLQISPATFYEKLAEIALLAYRLFLGIPPQGSHWDKVRLQAVGQRFGEKLIDVASWLSQRPVRPSPAMVHCDLAILHRVVSGVQALPATNPDPVVFMASSAPPVAHPISNMPLPALSSPTPIVSQPQAVSATSVSTNGKTSGTISMVTAGGRFDADPRGYRRPDSVETKKNPAIMEPADFGRFLYQHFLSIADGQTGQSNMGGS